MAIITSSEASTSAGPSTVRGNGQQDHQPSQKGHPHLREVAAEEEEEDDEEDELFQEASSQYIAGEGVQGDDDTVDSGDEEGDWHDTLQLAVSSHLGVGRLRAYRLSLINWLPPTTTHCHCHCH